MTGALSEIGPCFVTASGDGTIRNPVGWTDAANMLFIECVALYPIRTMTAMADS
jgi:carboxypeptidase C (cathepsin A)